MHRTLLATALAAALFSTVPVFDEPLWPFLGSLWGEEGCRLDPSGRCAGAATQADTGCMIDPSGRCAS